MSDPAMEAGLSGILRDRPHMPGSIVVVREDGGPRSLRRKRPYDSEADRPGGNRQRVKSVGAAIGRQSDEPSFFADLQMKFTQPAGVFPFGFDASLDDGPCQTVC